MIYYSNFPDQYKGKNMSTIDGIYYRVRTPHAAKLTL